MKIIPILATAVSAAMALDMAAQINNAERKAYIEALNSKPGMTWKAGFNSRFNGAKIGERLKTMAGVNQDPMQEALQGIASKTITGVTHVADDIPEEFDSEKNWPHCAELIGDIRDQSNCGCCWAFAAAEVASDRMCIATEGKMKYPLSAEDVCFCSNFDGCDGGQIGSAFYYIKKHGVVTGGQYNQTGPYKGFCKAFSLPHCHHHGPKNGDPYPAEGEPGCPSQRSPRCPNKCDAQATAPHKTFADDKITFDGEIETYHSEKSIQTAIMRGGPVAVAFDVHSDFENYVSGVYQHISGEMVGGHAVKIVGWGVENGVKYWQIANSWNDHWGDKATSGRKSSDDNHGYFKMLRGVNHCGIESVAFGITPHTKWGYKPQMDAIEDGL